MLVPKEICAWEERHCGQGAVTRGEDYESGWGLLKPPRRMGTLSAPSSMPSFSPTLLTLGRRPMFYNPDSRRSLIDARARRRCAAPSFSFPFSPWVGIQFGNRGASARTSAEM